MRLIVAAADGLRADAQYFPEFMAGFNALASATGYEAVDVREEELTDAIGNSSGAVVVMTRVAQCDLIDSLFKARYPIVAANHYRGSQPVSTVRVDDAGAVASIVERLVELRHCRIAFLTGPLDNLDAQDRREGFSEAVARLALVEAVIQTSDFHEEGGYEAARQLFSGDVRPTAVICSSDLAAVGVVKAARELGISVPIDLSVAGFGDFPMVEYVYPSITTVRQPRFELGRTAARLLIDEVNGREAGPREILLEAELVIRESTVPKFYV